MRERLDFGVIQCITKQSCEGGEDFSVRGEVLLSTANYTVLAKERWQGTWLQVFLATSSPPALPSDSPEPHRVSFMALPMKTVMKALKSPAMKAKAMKRMKAGPCRGMLLFSL